MLSQKSRISWSKIFGGGFIGLLSWKQTISHANTIPFKHHRARRRYDTHFLLARPLLPLTPLELTALEYGETSGQIVERLTERRSGAVVFESMAVISICMISYAKCPKMTMRVFPSPRTLLTPLTGRLNPPMIGADRRALTGVLKMVTSW